MASARGAAPARIAGRMRLVVVQENEEQELGGSGESQARCRRRRRPAHRAAGVGAVRAAWGGRGGVRRDRFGCADVDAPRDGCGVAGGPEHPLHRAPGPTPWRRALRAASPRGSGHPLAPHLQGGRHSLHRVRRTHDAARGRDGPRVHRSPPRRAASLARRDPSPPDLATVLRATRRAVAAPCPALDNRPLYVQRPARAESRPPHAPAPDTAPPSCEPSPLRWPTFGTRRASCGPAGSPSRTSGRRTRSSRRSRRCGRSLRRSHR